MRDFNTKVDDDPTSAGEVIAAEYNSLFGELKNVAKIVGALDEADSLQLLKAIDLMSKANVYSDVGALNAVVLTRLAVIGNVESLVDGLEIKFNAANTNTGAVMLKLNQLAAKPLKDTGIDIVAGGLVQGKRYVAIYDAANDWFEVSALGELAGAADEVAAGRTNSVKRADGTWSSKARHLSNDYALQTWAADLALGVYDVRLTVAQNGLPAGYWYIEVMRYGNDTPANQYRYLRATPMDATLVTVPVYHCSVVGGVWSAWASMGSKGLGDGQAWQNMIASRVVNIAYKNTTGRSIEVAIRHGALGGTDVTPQVGATTGTLIDVGGFDNGGIYATSSDSSFIVPNNHWYKLAVTMGNPAYVLMGWAELR